MRIELGFVPSCSEYTVYINSDTIPENVKKDLIKLLVRLNIYQNQ